MAINPVHFGGVLKCRDGAYRSFVTLCGLDGDCGNRDPKATTCRACKRSAKWEQAVMSVRVVSGGLENDPR